MDMVSIIIPVYNTNADDLQQTVDSIKCQTYSSFEVILIDDGSSAEFAQNLDDICRRDSRFRCIHRKNSGVSSSRNYGVQKAIGKYIVFVDADDLITPWCLEEGMDLIEKTSSDIVVGRIINTETRLSPSDMRKQETRYKVIESDSEREELVTNLFTKKQPSWLLDETGYILNCEGCWAHFIRKDVAIKYQFCEELAVGEDTLWGIQILKDRRYRICTTSSLWYFYIQNSYSVMNSYRANIADTLTKAVEKVYPTVCDLSDKEYEAFIGWTITKLKQIIYRAYLPDKCAMTRREKKRSIAKLLSQKPWRNIIYSKRKTNMRNNVMLILHKYNFMLDYFTIKNYLGKKV